jgi:zinc transporter 1/2/3
MDSLDVYKLTAFFLVGLMSLLGTVLSHHISSQPSVLSLANCATAGVFLAGGFLHLLADAIENPAFEAYSYPLALLFSCSGFLVVFFIEQVALAHHPAREEIARGSRGSSFLEGHHYDKEASAAVGFVLFLALSFHSVLEGLSIGAQASPEWSLVAMVAMHKALAAFALATRLTHLSATIYWIYMGTFSCMSMVGIAVAWLITLGDSDDSLTSGIILALSSGTFIFVALMELLPGEFGHHVTGTTVDRLPAKTRALRGVIFLAGFSIYAAMAVWI